MSLLIRPARTSDATACGSVGGELYQIHVDPDRFRLGIGTQLHEDALEVWRERGVSVGRLWAWEFNERAGQFYRRLGWRTDGAHRPDDPRVGEYRMIGYRLDVPLVCAVR